MTDERKPTSTNEPAHGAEDRDLQTEQTLCWAIEQHRQVTFGYRKDGVIRSLRPTVLFWSSNRKVSIGGTVVSAVGIPCERHVFEVGRITRLIVTSIHFAPDPLFDRGDKRYDGGIICSV